MPSIDNIDNHIYELDRKEFEDIVDNSIFIKEHAHIFYVKQIYDSYADVIVINCDKIKDKRNSKTYYIEVEYLRSPEYRSWSRKEITVNLESNGRIPNTVNATSVDAKRVNDNIKIIEKQSWPSSIKEKLLELTD